MKKEILVITSYPSKGTTHDRKTVGVASYTKKLLHSLKHSSKEWQMTVLCEKLDGKAYGYSEDGIEVRREWERANLSSLFGLGITILTSKQKLIALSFEAYMFGGLINALVVLFFLLLSRLIGKKVIILQHQVVRNFSEFGKDPLTAVLMSLLSWPFYNLVNLIANLVLVFEDQLAISKSGKVKVLSHLTPKVTTLPKDAARRKLGLENNKFYAFYFGYITPYKGTKWLVENWPDNKDWQLIIGGDINPNHVKNEVIREYVDDVKKIAKDKNNINTIGFVPEEKIDGYFSAVDVLILPYKTFMSSSGPMAIAFAHQLPILLSEKLRLYLKSTDFRKALMKSQVSGDYLIFNFTPNSLVKSLKRVVKQSRKFQDFSAHMAELRSEEKIGNTFSDLLAELL